ncbi:hypothetical protein ACTMTJ_33230 [Phytohabitans sp. LJ34]|uniref:hypothetical protein n=1 Tax=Phytohabitans sp. LJ34 TaxID=3452217 RepID=UPI003F8B5610
MIDPMMLAVATALATKAAEGLSEAGRAAFGALVQRVRSRLAAEPGGTGTLESAESHPGDERLVERLAAALSVAADRDPTFAADLARLWSAVRDAAVVAAHDGVVNQQSGSVGGHVVQARDVSGGITFGAGSAEDSRGGR